MHLLQEAALILCLPSLWLRNGCKKWSQKMAAKNGCKSGCELNLAQLFMKSTGNFYEYREATSSVRLISLPIDAGALYENNDQEADGENFIFDLFRNPYSMIRPETPPYGEKEVMEHDSQNMPDFLPHWIDKSTEDLVKELKLGRPVTLKARRARKRKFYFDLSFHKSLMLEALSEFVSYEFEQRVGRPYSLEIDGAYTLPPVDELSEEIDLWLRGT